MNGQANNSAITDATSPSTSTPKDCYLIVYNVSKKANIGTICRCATAFNVKEVCVVGCKEFNTFGSHGADRFVDVRSFDTLENCCQSLRSLGCEIIGVEIIDGAIAVHKKQFTGNVAFMLGNEGQGLNDRQIACCDSFIYISQYGPGTASLNVAVAASIVLHTYALWAGYGEREREGNKYMVPEELPVVSAEEGGGGRSRRRGCFVNQEDIKTRRIAAREEADDDGDVAGLDFSDLGIDLLEQKEV
jgi:tRNA C32,U32 (ribose-2'-O)-methylase TrmJ